MSGATDGVQLSLLFERRERSDPGAPVAGPTPTSGPFYHLPNTVRVIGIDPSLTVILTIVEHLGDGSYRLWELSRTAYYAQCGLVARAMRGSARRKAVQHVDEILSKHPSAVTTVSDFRTHVAWIGQCAAAIWQTRRTRSWSRDALGVYIRRHETVAALLIKSTSRRSCGSGSIRGVWRGELSEQCGWLRICSDLLDEEYRRQLLWS
jgi:hypothetical protein